MKNKLLIIFATFFYCNIYSSDVSGSVYLDDDTNHENIKITFSPISPTGIYKEVFSNMDGSFNTSIENGVYSITYFKNGYLDYTINEILLNGVISLDDVVLSSNSLIEVFGAVEGNWTNNNTYKVTGDINVLSNKSLNIEEGTEIKFDGYYSFTVDGTLIANGSENQPIIFTSNNGSTVVDFWNQMIINSNSTTSIINNCIIEYAKRSDDNFAGVIKVNGNAILSNNIVRNTEETGIEVRTSGNVSLINNLVYNCRAGILTSSTENGNITIESNKINNINLIGIGSKRFDQSLTNISNNEIYDCGLYGIQVTGNMNVKRNLVHNIDGIGSCAIFVNGDQPVIQNNTLILNTNGISLYDGISFNPYPIINSNIIAYNTDYGIYSLGLPKPAEVKYNLFFNNNLGLGNNLPTGVGSVITSNNNGTPSDAFFNIFSNPELSSIAPLDDNFCDLNSNSPAINAGDPNFNDPDNSIIDIGVKSVQRTLSVSDVNHSNSEKNNLIVFPNPIKEIIKFESNSGFNAIEIYDSIGKMVHFVNFKNKQYKYKWSQTSILSNGFYLYHVKNENGIIKSGKLIKK